MSTSALYASLTRITDPAARDVARQAADAISNLTVRVTNAQQELVQQQKLTLANIQKALQANGSNPLIITGLPGAAAQTLEGTHAARPAAANVKVGTFYVETDRISLYVVEAVASVNTWVFVAGMMTGALTLRPVGLGASDVGFLFYSNADSPVAYDHVWRWDGTKWVILFGLMTGTFSQRPAPASLNNVYDVNFRFAATDQNRVTWRFDGTNFLYESGYNTRTQAQLGALAALLTASDAGYPADVTDFKHQLKWTGAAWDFVDGDTSGYVAIGKPDGTAPNGGVWGICDGTAYTVLNADGTTTNTTTQNLTGGVFITGAAASGSQVAASVPTWQAAQATDSATTGITVTAHTGAASTAGAGAAIEVFANVGDLGHTVNDAGHTHGLSDANAKLNAPSVANGGLPLNIAVVFYLRR